MRGTESQFSDDAAVYASTQKAFNQATGEFIKQQVGGDVLCLTDGRGAGTGILRKEAWYGTFERKCGSARKCRITKLVRIFTLLLNSWNDFGYELNLYVCSK